jgi:LacI family transcriptional regulator
MRLKELSDYLGISQTTVSRALGGYPEVSEKTRLKVQAAADKFHYSANTRAKSLATGRAMMIGHILPGDTKNEMVNPIFGDFLSGASSTYTQHGYDLMLSQVATGDEKRAYTNLKSKGAIDGLIVQGPSIDEPRIKLLNKLKIPFVLHGRASNVSEPYNWVDVNNTHCFLRATDFLLSLGHTKIALINGLEHLDFAQRRRTGYLESLKTAHINVQPEYMHCSQMTEDQGYDVATAMLELPTPPTAFLVSSLISAIGVRRAIHDKQLVMGKDVSVITHDDDISYLRNGRDIPIFTATRSSVFEAGQLCAKMLIDVIENPSANNKSRQVLLESQLLVGQSTGPAPKG